MLCVFPSEINRQSLLAIPFTGIYGAQEAGPVLCTEFGQ